MKKLFIIFLLIASVNTLSAQNDTIEIKGALGLTFGMSKLQVQNILTKKGGIIDKAHSKQNVIVYDKVKFGVRATDFLLLKFVNNKLYEITAEFSCIKPKTQELFDLIKSDIETKYQTGACYRDFKSPYTDGDGYEITAIQGGYASITCYWSSTKKDAIIALEINESLSVVLTYQDNKLIDEKEKTVEKINNADF